MTQWINSINDVLWSYILIIMLLGCALWFTFKTKFVQFRMLKEMIRLLGDSTGKSEGKEHHISSFQAFAVSLASRVGTGNLAGVATAISIGGPGAVFWMWIIALLGASSAFVESTLAQLYKVHGKASYIGGPAYYMKNGLKQPWMGILFSLLIIFTFAFAFNTVQSNTICAAFEKAFQIDHTLMGSILTILTLVIIFGGVQRIAKVSGIIVPVMALGYILLALVIVGMNITHLPDVMLLIVRSAFGWEQALGGGIGMTLMQGIKRGLFSNEAGMGSAPNVAASADVTHPVKQGLIQTLGVFTDTLIKCSCTAFIILFSGVYQNGEANLRHLTENKKIVVLFRIMTGGMVMFGALASLDLAWSLADVCMALMTICNLIAITLLGKYAFRLLEDYREQKRHGIKDPVFTKDKMKDIQQDIECW